MIVIDRLRTALARINPTIPLEALDEASRLVSLITSTAEDVAKQLGIAVQPPILCQESVFLLSDQVR